MSITEALSSAAAFSARIRTPAQQLSLGGNSLFLGVQRETFGLVDTDGNGRVSAAEFLALGKDDQAGAAVFAGLDGDGDGELALGDLSGSRLFDRATLNGLLRLQETDAGRFALQRADGDGDGGLSAAEYAAFVPAKTGFSDRDVTLANGLVDRQFAEMDADRNGALSADELNAGFDGALQPVRLFGTGASHMTAPAFARTDADADGALSADELAGVVGAEPESVKSLVRQADANGDGRVTRDEFDRMVGRRPEFYDRPVWRVTEKPSDGELLLAGLLRSTAWALTDQFAKTIGGRVDASA
jgi:Ca2+-binding EF-hand superfamily protein